MAIISKFLFVILSKRKDWQHSDINLIPRLSTNHPVVVFFSQDTYFNFRISEITNKDKRFPVNYRECPKLPILIKPEMLLLYLEMDSDNDSCIEWDKNTEVFW